MTLQYPTQTHMQDMLFLHSNNSGNQLLATSKNTMSRQLTSPNNFASVFVSPCAHGIKHFAEGAPVIGDSIFYAYRAGLQHRAANELVQLQLLQFF